MVRKSLRDRETDKKFFDFQPSKLKTHLKRPSDWLMIHFQDYRAEGGKHIVVYNAINRTVLRIIKADRGEKVSLKSEKAEIEKRLKYERHVIVSTS